MTTLALPYYGHLYHRGTGYERVYFIVDYDSVTERTHSVRLGIWDQRRTPGLDAWLEENGVQSVVCRDMENLPLLEQVAKRGITVMGQGSRCAQTCMNKLLL